jgi:hypothetical protein
VHGVIDLEAWRRQHADPGDHRLAGALDRLDAVLRGPGWDRPPPWVVTELLAVQGCLSLGLDDEAAWRIEKLVQRAERIRPRAGAR